MWWPVGIALSALALGGLGGWLGGSRTLHGAQAFAVTAVVAIATTHLLPEATAVLGWTALGVFALTVAAPHGLMVAVARSRGLKDANRATPDLAFLGVLLHQMGDGIGISAIGALGEERNAALIGLFVHTLPLAVMVMVMFRGAGDLRGGWIRIAVLMAATAIGTGVGAALGLEQHSVLAPWLQAGVAGLLVHVVLHIQTPEHAPDGPSRAVELGALVLGLAIAFLAGSVHADPAHAGHGHSHAHAEGPLVVALAERIVALTRQAAVPMLLGLGTLWAVRRTVAQRRGVEPTLPTLAWWRSALQGPLGSALSVLSPPSLLVSLALLGPAWTACWMLPAAALRPWLSLTERARQPWLGPVHGSLVWFGFGTAISAWLLQEMPPVSAGTWVPGAAAIAAGAVLVAGVPTIGALALTPALVSLPPPVLGAVLGASTLQLRGTPAREIGPATVVAAVIGAGLAPGVPPQPPGPGAVAGLAALGLVVFGVASLWRHGLLEWVDALTPEHEHADPPAS